MAKLAAIQRELGVLDTEETGVIVDLLLSYRALEAWTEMIELCDAMPDALRRQVLVREQLAFALNRRAGQQRASPDRERALALLLDVLDDQGDSAETCGLVGRIYKDRWEIERSYDELAAQGYLRRSIEFYERGFEADSRDAYPGINLVTLLDVLGDDSSLQRRDDYLPVVEFAVRRRMRSGDADYWDYASRLELAILKGDRAGAERWASEALAVVRESWEPQTTARNLTLIAEARAARGDALRWVDLIVDALGSAGR